MITSKFPYQITYDIYDSSDDTTAHCSRKFTTVELAVEFINDMNEDMDYTFSNILITLN